MKELSRITARFSESTIREMTRICDDVNGYNLSQGFPDFDSPKEICEAAIRAIAEGKNQYPVTFGEPELRRAISAQAKRYNKIECNPNTEITVTCGSTEAMIATLKAIINPGDEIIIFEPFYENYGPDGILSGASPRYVELKPPNWTYNLSDLENAFTCRTKAIVINTTNNPTGKVFSRSELGEIAKLCQKWDVYAITDEIYEHILYDEAEHVSLASLPGMERRTVTISSISKSYSVTGWRVGWAIASAEITGRIRKVHDFLTVGAPTPFQHAAVRALDFDQSYYRALRSRYSEARQFLHGSLLDAGFECHMPKGAYYLVAQIRPTMMQRLGADNDVSFSKKLIELTKIATVPGSSFYSDAKLGSSQIRFCFCKRWETLKAVKKALESKKAQLKS